MFLLIEKFSEYRAFILVSSPLIANREDSPSEYVGDSVGGHFFIGISASRPCSDYCACRLLDRQAGKGIFAFAVYKTDSTITVELYSFSPRSNVGRYLGFMNDKIDGLFLLEHTSWLETLLQDLRIILHQGLG